jgi:two-component system, NarL family, sensor histidine kinase DegS
MKNQFKHWREGELLLGLVRILALILALALFLLFSEVRPFIIPNYILISMVVIYSILRIFYPSYKYGNIFVTCGIAAFDVIFCCFLPFVTGGLHSPFILFPLTAILSIALYFKQRITYLVSIFVSCSAIGSEIMARRLLGNTDYMPVQVYVAILAMYCIIAFLIAWLPYVANLNVSATIKKKTIVEERSRLSREIHDSLAQRIGSSILKIDVLRGTLNNGNTADALKQIANIKHDMQETYLEVRDIIDQLRVQMPDNPRMLPTLAQYTQEFAQSTGINCQLYMADGHADIQPLATVELLRIVQEALNNVKKHSGADQIEVKFESTDDAVKVIIRDNGKGFTTNTVKGQHGLTVMKERAESLGGHLDIISSPGRGTTVEVTITAQSPMIRRLRG